MCALKCVSLCERSFRESEKSSDIYIYMCVCVQGSLQSCPGRECSVQVSAAWRRIRALRLLQTAALTSSLFPSAHLPLFFIYLYIIPDLPHPLFLSFDSIFIHLCHTSYSGSWYHIIPAFCDSQVVLVLVLVLVLVQNCVTECTRVCVCLYTSVCVSVYMRHTNTPTLTYLRVLSTCLPEMLKLFLFNKPLQSVYLYQCPIRIALFGRKITSPFVL